MPKYTHYYCQPDGGQWNIPVFMEDQYLPEECGSNVIIHGETLVSNTVDAEGHGIMLVKRCDVLDHPVP